MDFLEFLKSSCYYSDVKFDMRDNKIYQWQTSIYTGFSLHKVNDYELRVEYNGSETGYRLRHYSSDYNIYKDGSYTNFDLRDSGYGDLRLYKGGSSYGQVDYMKEKEEREKELQAETEENSLSSSSSSGNNDDSFSNGFWSWKSWGEAFGIIACFTFSLGGVIMQLISPYLLLVAPGVMAVWAVMLIIYKIKKRRRRH